jgi:hypothetical protein
MPTFRVTYFLNFRLNQGANKNQAATYHAHENSMCHVVKNLLLGFVLCPLVCFPSQLIWNYGSYRQSVGHLRRGSALSQSHYLHRITQTQNKPGQKSMPWVGFEPTISVLERANTVHALVGAPTLISTVYSCFHFVKTRKIGLQEALGRNNRLSLMTRTA